MDGEAREKMSRRIFLRIAGRSAGLAALGGLAWAAGFRSGSPGAQEKLPRSRCGRCRVLSVCSRPDALQVRDVLGLEPDLKKLGRIGAAERLCEGSTENRASSTIGR